jgi:hypothetical protein
LFFRVDQAVGEGLASNRKRHWSQSLKTWELTMLLLVNAYKLYLSATGNIEVSPPMWKDRVRRVWGGLPETEDDVHPPASLLSSQRRCQCCESVSGRRTLTNRMCNFCGPICKHCDNKCSSLGCKICASFTSSSESTKSRHTIYFEGENISSRKHTCERKRKRGVGENVVENGATENGLTETINFCPPAPLSLSLPSLLPSFSPSLPLSTLSLPSSKRIRTGKEDVEEETNFSHGLSSHVEEDSWDTWDIDIGDASFDSEDD